MVVLFDSPRSAEPPQNSGRTSAIALMTLPEAARVATSLSLGKVGIDAAQFAGNSLFCRRARRAAASGFAAFHDENSDSHAARAAWPRSITLRVCATRSSGAMKLSSGLSPSATFVAATSLAPRADPCDFDVPRAFGAGHAMTVFKRIRVGASVSASAFTIAASSASRSTFPSPSAATSNTFQP